MRSSNTEQQMGEAARRLKNLAKELDIWIIALSQLNRDQMNPAPSLARLRASGQIAEAADVVMLIYRPELYGKYYPEPFQNYPVGGTAMIDIAKGRNIGLARFIVKFEAKTTHFMEYDDSGFTISQEVSQKNHLKTNHGNNQQTEEHPYRFDRVGRRHENYRGKYRPYYNGQNKIRAGDASSGRGARFCEYSKACMAHLRPDHESVVLLKQERHDTWIIE